jgi:hypothetical protein
MAISTTTQLEAAISNSYSIINGSKPSLSNALTGQFFSTWNSAGLPGTGAIPTVTPVVLTNATTGGFKFAQQTAPRTSYLADLKFTTSLVGATVEIHDRLVHMGGLSATVITTQTITGFDLSTLSGTSNLAARIGDSNYSDVQWWLEIYTDLGSGSSTATINVTFNDATTGNLTPFNVGNADRRLGRMFPLNSLILAADQGKFIQGINSVTLSSSTATAGNFGFVATRYRSSVFAEQPNELYKNGWTKTALAEVFNSSCLSMIVLVANSNTTTGTVTLNGKIIHG